MVLYEYIWIYKNGIFIFNSEKRIFLVVVVFGEFVVFWDFSVRFKVNMKLFNRKNCCVVIFCIFSWVFLVVVIEKLVVMLFWDFVLGNYELFFFFIFFRDGVGGMNV